MRITERKKRQASRLRIGGFAIAAIISSFVGADGASAYYIGPSYLKVPGISGDAKLEQYKGWVRTEAHYWTKHPSLREIRGITGAYNGLKFTGPMTPAKGPDMLAVSVDKNSPALKPLMEACTSGATIPEVTFAESSEMARHPQEHGPRPTDVPEYFQYELKGVHLACPVVSDAPEQAFEVSFDDIQWLNYQPQPKPREVTSEPAKLPAAPKSGTSKVFVISWFAPISDSRDDQCPKMNTKPAQDSYYALMSKERADAQRAFLKDKGGVNTMYLPFRGPDELNVIMLPGIVPDPGHVSPQVDVVRGFDLDGDDGSGPPPPNTREHKNYVSPDGRRGIDNQLFTVQGCIAGWRRNGFLPMIGNELRRAGGLSVLVEISGIDDERNDNDVAVTIYYSADPIKRDGTSKIILSDYTYRVNPSPEYSQDFARFRGKIVDGVLTTEPLKRVTLHEGPATTWSMMDARMRIEFHPDGTMSAVLGGYRNWREFITMAFFRGSDYENTIGFQAPGMYNAVRRAADGLKDPVTGEFTGISAAYEMEGVPAFIPPEQQKKLLAGLSIDPTTKK
jgi:type VI protein secretion system component Hcp